MRNDHPNMKTTNNKENEMRNYPNMTCHTALSNTSRAMCEALGLLEERIIWTPEPLSGSGKKDLRDMLRMARELLDLEETGELDDILY